MEFLGHQTTRHLYESPGRDDVIEVPVGRRVSEVVFVMVAELPQDGGHCAISAGALRTVWTLYNARFATVRGTVLAVEHYPGARYRDLWHDRPLEPEIVDGRALLAVDLDPQGLGCVLQQRQ